MTGESIISVLHARRPGITEDLLVSARDDHGRNPYDWLAEVLPRSGSVLDLCCGSAPLAEHVGADRYLGVDNSPEELAAAAARRPDAGTIHADVGAADLGDRTFEAVALSMALMLPPLEAVLARARGWLVPAGVLAATVPLRDTDLAGTPYNRLLTALGWRGEPFPEPLDDLAERAGRQGFAVDSDELRFFGVPIARTADRDLLLSSFYLPDGGPDQIAAGEELLLAEVTAGRPSLGYPIRRIQLVRTVGGPP